MPYANAIQPAIPPQAPPDEGVESGDDAIISQTLNGEITRLRAPPAAQGGRPMQTAALGPAALRARELAWQLLAAHGLDGWTFRFNRSRANLGLCRWGERTIELSLHFVERNSDEAVRQTLLHEVAHALAGRPAGHGPDWKAVCLRIGALPERLSFQADMPKGRWQAVCGSCGRLHDRHRRPKRMVGWYCAYCGPQRGKLAWAVQPACAASP